VDSTEDKTGDVKSRILHAAADLFMERGFSGTTVREIGERAELSQSSLYHHAQSKGHLLRELHETHAREIVEMLENVIQSNAKPTLQLRGVINALMSVVHTHRAVVTVFLREGYALPQDARDEVNKDRERVHSIIDLVLTKGVEAGEFRSDLDIHLTRLAIVGMCNWSYQWYRPDGARSMSDVSNYFADLVVLGVRDTRRTRRSS
jgi:AcrR family transcriptional regulator